MRFWTCRHKGLTFHTTATTTFTPTSERKPWTSYMKKANTQIQANNCAHANQFTYYVGMVTVFALWVPKPTPGQMNTIFV